MKPAARKSKETKVKTGVSPRWKLYQLLHQLKTREAMQLAEQSLKRCLLLQDYRDVILTPTDLLRAAKGSRQLQGFPQLPYPMVDNRRRALKVLPKSTLTAVAH